MTTEKSQAEIKIEALQNVFGIATTGFEAFYKEANEKCVGISSTAASSGNNSTAASAGYNSTAASSGNNSKAASAGYNSTAASSGNNSKAASSGEYSTAASAGYNSTAASSGKYSKAASAGNNSTAASSGNNSKAASSGEYSTAASAGYNSTAASSGKYSKAASSGISSKAASSGEYSTAASAGISSKAASSGEYSACAAVGVRAAVKGDKGNLIMASEYALKADKYVPIGGKADIVDGKKLKAGCWYIVEGGEWVEVDFTDEVFSRVISTRNGVKKVKTESGKIFFVVSDENGNSAHGTTIKKAREDLIYKVVAKFDGKLPKKATGKEWVSIYRNVTGACSAGVRNFVEQTGKSLDDVYTAREIAELASGQFGAEKFAEKIKESK